MKGNKLEHLSAETTPNIQLDINKIIEQLGLSKEKWNAASILEEKKPLSQE